MAYISDNRDWAAPIARLPIALCSMASDFIQSFIHPVAHSSSRSFELSGEAADRQHGGRSESDASIKSGARPDAEGARTEHAAVQSRV
jgi:hypothetical protein